MNKLDTNYQNLLQDILDNGVKKETRNGGTISVFGRQIRHKMSDGFPLLTTKKMAWKQIVTELLWFLRGDTNIKYLVDNGCHIWDGDAYKRYYNAHPDAEKSFQYEGSTIETRRMTKEEFIDMIKTDDEFAKKWGELGPIYGGQWRDWNDNGMEGDYLKGIDQIANLIKDLKTNPDSRRLMVSAWNVGELDSMTLPPCHYGFQVYTRELSHKERCDLFGHNDSIDRDYSYSKWLDDNGFPKRAISLMWNQRSVDTFLGLPFNIASYGLLLEIIAKEVNMVPDELIGNLGDVHLYSNHIEQAKEQISREPYELPKLVINDEFWNHEHQRSVDTFLGLPFNITSYGLLLEIIAKATNMVSDKLIGNLGDVHLYSNHIEQAKEQISRESYELPKLVINDEFWNHEHQTIDGWINSMEIGDFQVEGYQSHPTIKAPLSN